MKRLHLAYCVFIGITLGFMVGILSDLVIPFVTVGGFGGSIVGIQASKKKFK